MKKWKRRLFQCGSLAATAAIMLTAFSLPGSIFRLQTSAEPGDNCTSRIEPSSYIENSLEGSTVRRDYTYLYDDGMYDEAGNDLMVPMGPFVYTKGNEEGTGELTYRLPYAVDELKITGIEVQGDPNNSFQGFWISNDGESWEEFAMTPSYENTILAKGEYGNRRGVSYYGSSDQSFQYVKVGFGRNWMPGIHYLYIPPAEDAANCTEKVDPAAEGVVVEETNTATNVTLARHNHSNTFTHDETKGMAYNGLPNNGGLVTFKLPYAVDSLKMTGVEVYWPNTTRGDMRFLSFEVSANGESWIPFSTAGSDFTFINTAGNRNDNPAGVSLPVNRVGITYYGMSDIRFRYVRIAFGRDWAPQLCNFYIPPNTIELNCTTQVDPVEVFRSFSNTGSHSSTYGRDNTYQYDGVGIFCFKSGAPNGGKMMFELPYAVDELKMTGVEIITDGANTNPPKEFRFKGFRVSTDGEIWQDLNMTRQLDGFVSETGNRREGITFYGASDTNFRYVEVTFGKDWIPGIGYFYLPPPSVTYYIDSKQGSDSNDGLSEEKPFKSLSQLSSKFFREGDQILFKRGETYSGSLTLKGYGTASNPIRVGTYGSGGMPKIDGNGARAGITLTANHIVVDGLEVTNPDGYYGIYIGTLQAGENSGITVSNCYVHDVDTNEKKFSYLESGGIIARADGTSPTWFKGLNIQGNTIKNVCRCAVVISNSWGWRYSGGSYIKNEYVSDTDGWYPNVDCKITGNTIDGSKGDSILVQCGKNTLIERNTVYNANSSIKDHAKVAMVAIWTVSTVDTVMQYNEVGYTKRPGADGEAFDTDHAEVNCKIQYNYSHNNEGGFVLLCNGMSGTAKNATVRYNLSVNDGAKCAVINLIGDVPGTQVYNNTFYLGNQVKSVMSMWGNDGRLTKANGITFTNNIFSAPTAGTGSYWSGGSVGTDFYNAVTNIQFNNNLFHNVNQPQQKGGVTLSGNVSGNPNFALSTDYKNKANMIKGFTPRNKVSGAVDVANNGGKDINGKAILSNYFGCVNH